MVGKYDVVVQATVHKGSDVVDHMQPTFFDQFLVVKTRDVWTRQKT